MLFSIKITSENDEVIEIGKEEKPDEQNVITNVEILMDTVENEVSNKSNAMLAKIKIFGEIKAEIKSELLKLFEWSKASSEEEWYRTLEIKIKIAKDKNYRSYKIAKVFVVDYFEIYKGESLRSKNSNNIEDRDHFELYLTQKENNFDNIEAG